jgi:uncharacterized membrane protein
MVLQLLIGLLFAISPVMELRGAIPIIINWGLSNNQPYYPYIILAILLNILSIMIVFSFLDLLHGRLLEWDWYHKRWNHWVHTKLRRKIRRIEKKQGIGQYILLLLFIAIPLPGTGVWTSSTIVWILGMNRTKSFFFLSLGAIVAGTVIFLVSMGLMKGLFY